MSASDPTESKLAEALAECERLREENRQLRGRLGVPRVETSAPPASVSIMLFVLMSCTFASAQTKLGIITFTNKYEAVIVAEVRRVNPDGLIYRLKRSFFSSDRSVITVQLDVLDAVTVAAETQRLPLRHLVAV